MTALIVIVWSLLGAVIGMVLLGELGPLFGVRQMEGAAAMFGLMTGAPLGLIGGGVFGYAMAQRYVNVEARRRFIRWTFGGVAALIASGFVFEWIRTNDYIDTQYQSSRTVSCRIRLAPGLAPPDTSQKMTLELRSDKETRKSSPYSTPVWETKDGRAETYSSVEAYRATPNRNIAVTIGTGPTYVYKLNAPARMKTYSYESEWMTPLSVEGAGGAAVEAKCGM